MQSLVVDLAAIDDLPRSANFDQGIAVQEIDCVEPPDALQLYEMLEIPAHDDARAGNGGKCHVKRIDPLESSQSRVAKMEAGDRSVSLDLRVRSLRAVGLTQRKIARAIAASVKRRAA